MTDKTTPQSSQTKLKSGVLLLGLVFVLTTLCACGGRGRPLNAETTGYCGCGKCCGWERGSWKALKLNVWSRYNTTGKNRGEKYSGLTASGTAPREPNPGLFLRPWYLLSPWLWFPHDGTLAADTRHYPFGTRFYIPGYGYGTVEDRGSAIKGKARFDLYFKSHNQALKWGRKKLDIYRVD
ncbi:MAG: 3D domain-containing protein [Deltaproteobacteria bacterium]|nr:3D domain-containing protein [Deltaproteobacteria bacterium]